MAQAIAPARCDRLLDARREANPGNGGPTMPSEAPVIRTDYILVGDGLAVVRASRLGHRPNADGFYPSDHRGVVAILDTGWPEAVAGR